ncbi:AAA family ATPase [Streptomyces sp. NPDC058855]|uniref:AAA family ATPase n=1 Tax=Streptomyces sp. NPDC058855 TaxID=3346651 RepID=UPI0036B60034
MTARVYGHGLVTGAFCPPHAGHHHLVRTALARCERVTVLVRATEDAALPLDARVAWMREIHPDALVVTGDTAADLPEPVDAVFTAGPYGDGDADAGGGPGPGLEGAEIVRVGGRPAESAAAVPGSGPTGNTGTVGPGFRPAAPDRPLPDDTAVLADPPRHWDLLEAPVRAALTRRVVVLGAESTGATSLARALTDHYRRRGGVWARTRCLAADPRADRERESHDFPVAAQRRAEDEERAAREGSPLLVCDGDAFAATIRHERRFGTPSPGTCAVAARGRHHLWLLTDHRGVPSGPDPEDLRAWTTARLLTRLLRTGRPTVLLSGPPEERLATAVAAVDALLAQPWEARR